MGTYSRIINPLDYYEPDIIDYDEPTQIWYKKGDAAVRQYDEPTVILQVCNNIGAYGAGFSGAINRQYPGVRAEYKAWLENFHAVFGKDNTLGQCLILEVEKEPYPVVVVNMIAQRGIKDRVSDPCELDYDALESCLTHVAKHFVWDFRSSDMRWVIQMPRIGCGLAGGRWEKVWPIIKRTLCEAAGQVHVYDI